MSRFWSKAAGALSLAAVIAAGSGAQEQRTFFDSADSNHDGGVTREEFLAATAKWLGPGPTANESQLKTALDGGFPESVFAAMLRGAGPQNQTPKPEDVERMMAALPAQAPAKPARPRKVLVLSKANGYVHSCIPLAAKTVEEMGKKTGAWATTVTYDPAAITASNLKQYDLVFLNNTTGEFLNDTDPKVTAVRKKALLDFVRSGKGLAGIHAAGDSYHKTASGSPGLGYMMAPLLLKAADTDDDNTLSAAELNTLSNKLFDKMDQGKTGTVSVADMRGKLLFALFEVGAAKNGGQIFPSVGRQGQDFEEGTWPEFNKMIGGYFKYHWLYPQKIDYKIDDPDSSLTAMFRGQQFSIEDETYTFSSKSWSRQNLHVLTSIDYSKMSEADKKKEDYPREDHDYGLSWIRREGKGRVFYEAHGHDEHVYALKPMLEHLLAGMQYALGDLKVDDAPGK
jgi:type 1 glutamine amidotransferase